MPSQKGRHGMCQCVTGLGGGGYSHYCLAIKLSGGFHLDFNLSGLVPMCFRYLRAYTILGWMVSLNQVSLFARIDIPFSLEASLLCPQKLGRGLINYQCKVLPFGVF